MARTGAAADLYKKLSVPPVAPLTPADRAYIDANKLRNEIAERLADHVSQGIVEAKDFEFPDEDLPRAEQMRALNRMKFRLQAAYEDRNLTPDARAKRLAPEFAEFKSETRGLIRPRAVDPCQRLHVCAAAILGAEQVLNVGPLNLAFRRYLFGALTSG